MRTIPAALVLVCAASAADTPMLAVSVRGDNAVKLYDVQFTALFGGNAWLRPAKTIAVGKAPGEMCLAPDGKKLFVSDVGDKKVTIVDVKGAAAAGELTAPGMQSPDGCVVSADSKKLYSVDQQANVVFVFSVDSKAMLRKIAVGKEPRRAILSPDGKRILISNAHSDSLSVIDPATDEIVKTVKTGGEPRDLAYSPDGKLLAVGLIADDCVELFKADTLEHKQQAAAVRSPQHIEFSPDSQKLYVVGKLADQVGILRVGDSARMAATVSVPHGPLGLWDAWGMALSPDGKFMWVTNMGENTITLIDVEMLQVSHAFDAGKFPVALVYIKPTGGITAMDAPVRLERYRSLARAAMDAVKKNDLAAATKSCQTLEMEWDAAELALRRASPDVWNQVDEAMDAFIHPITTSGGKAPSAAELDAAYQAFLAKLKLVR